MSDKRFIFRFFWLHFCLIIPVLLVSVLITGIIVGRIEKQEQQNIRNQLSNVARDLSESVSSYQEESILLSENQELQPLNMAGDIRDIRRGIEVLQMKLCFDNRISYVFMDYGDSDYVYAADGMTSRDIYLSKVLGCREESAERGLAAMDTGENAYTFLYKSDKEGYMMYCYPTRKIGQEYVLVSFMMSMEEMKDMFQLNDQSKWYYLEAKDGSTLAVGYEASGNAVVLSEDEWKEMAASGRYDYCEDRIRSIDMDIRLYYDKHFFGMENGLYQMQIFNILLIAVGTTLSAGISWMLSKHRMREILHLESMAKGEVTEPSGKENVYSRLQNMIVNGFQEMKQQEVRASEREVQFRNKNVYMIFHGMFQEVEDVEATFRELGFDGCPKCFFVGILTMERVLTKYQMPPILEACLVTQEMEEGKERLIFLCDLQMEDDSRVQRNHIAENISAYFGRQGAGKVCVGMSRVYRNPLLIDSAYKEAISVLALVESGKMKDAYGCWDEAVQETDYVLPDEAALGHFAQILKEQELEEANKWLRYLLQTWRIQDCPMRNQIYLRHEILRLLVVCINDRDGTEKKLLLQECLNVNVQDEKEFIQSVRNILSRICLKKEEDHFARMLRYIDHNYGCSDLTYEEVAEAGGVTKTYVSKLFRARLGMSYIEYLTSVRMDNACVLLRTTDTPINEIVKMVGYENVPSFRRGFKERYGISATEYRKQNR